MKLKLSWIITLLMALTIQFSFAQEKTITGTVTGAEDGLPLPGVTILVKGTTRGTQTDFDGNYSIRASVGETLVFSYVGNKTVESVVGASNTIDVSMETDSESLEEVVVTGYSKASTAKLTSSVSTVTNEEVRDVPLATFEQILQGRAPGVFVASGSGQPGTVANVVIRGTNSINGNTTPLYIVDGIQIDPASFAALNPNDFESFTILKDAQAKSLYGARAAAGVIVITTKSGRVGAPSVQYRTFSGVSIVPELQVDVLNATQFLEQSRIYGVNGAANLTDEQIAQQVADLNGFDVRDALVRTGTTTNHELVITGGSEGIQYFTSGSYFEQEGTARGSDLQRLATRTNLNIKASEKFNVSVNTGLTFSRRNDLPSNGGGNLANPFLALYTGNPVTPVFNEDGSFNTGGGLARALPNILEDTELGIREGEEFKLITTANLNYQFNDQFSASFNIGVDYEDDFIVNALNPETFRGQTLPDLGNEGQQNENSIRDLNFTSTLKLQYQNTFAEKHSVTVAGFVEAFRRDFRSSNFTGFGLEQTLFGFANAITAGTVDNALIPTVGGAIVRNGLFSVFANGSYDYDDRFGFDFGVRYDESSRVAINDNSEVFYSVGARWNITNESFMESVDWVNSLKLRASFGTSGNDSSVGSTAAFQQLAAGGLFQGQRTLVRGGVADRGINWEIQEDLNIGVDFSLFNSRFSGSVDWYRNITRDLIIPFNISAAFGDTNVNTNAGELENEGVEVDLRYNLINSGDWNLSFNFNAAYNFGVITDLGDQVDEFEAGTAIFRVGERLNSHFVVPFAGVNPVNGDPLYRDLDGNITSQFSDNFQQTGFGSSDPLYTGGFGFDVGWKGISLSTLFVFAAEVDRFNNTTFFTENLNFLGSGLNQSVTILDAWMQPGDITNIPRLTANREFSSADIESADYLRLRNVQLAYTFPDSIIDSLPINALRVYAQGVNLLTFTEFTGADPEDNNNIAQFEFPNPRIISFGLDLTF